MGHSAPTSREPTLVAGLFWPNESLDSLDGLKVFGDLALLLPDIEFAEC